MKRLETNDASQIHHRSEVRKPFLYPELERDIWVHRKKICQEQVGNTYTVADKMAKVEPGREHLLSSCGYLVLSLALKTRMLLSLHVFGRIDGGGSRQCRNGQCKMAAIIIITIIVIITITITIIIINQQ